MTYSPVHIFRSLVSIKFVLASVCLALCGCMSRSGSEKLFVTCDIPGWEFVVDADSVITRVGRNSGLMSYSVGMIDARADSVMSGLESRLPECKTGVSIADAAYRLGTAMLNCSHDSLHFVSPYAVYLAMAAVDPELSRRSLDALVQDGRIVGFDYGNADTDVCRWPLNSSTRMMWAMAAWQLYCVTGDKEWLAYAYRVIDRTIAADVMVLLDPEYGLFHGTAVDDTDMIGYHYPAWMTPVDRYQTMSLTVNVLAERSMHILALMSRELGHDPRQHMAMSRTIRNAINDHLWLPNLGYYSQYLYGGAFPIQSYVADSRGEAFAAALGMVNDSQCGLMLSRVPRTPYGLAVQFPLVPTSRFALADMPTEAIWAIAAREGGNAGSLSASLFSILRRIICCDAYDGSSYAVEMDNASAVYAVYIGAMAGIGYHPDGITITPLIPDGLIDPLRLSGLRYGDAVYDIIINGSGSVISSIALDGVPLSGNLLPRDLSGRHKVEVTVVKPKKTSLFQRNDTETLLPVWAPPTPRVNTSGSKRIHIANYADSLSYAVYVNGQRMDDISTGSYPRIKAKGYTAVSFVPIASYRWMGYSSRPYAYIPHGGELRIQAEDYTTPVSFVRSVRPDHDSLVEISPQINTRLSMHVDIADDGQYIIDVRYADTPLGGPVAMRSLFVNGRRCGVIVMPRLGRYVDADKMGYSNSVKAVLNAGANIISLDYLVPYNINPEDEANSVLVDCIRLIKL